MDLLDLIADSKTDSLPAGFLRSIKIKYRQEASHVFPKEKLNEAEEGENSRRSKTAESEKSTPSFMEWKVPSRLVATRPQAPLPQTPASGILSRNGERQNLCSRLSRLTLKSAGEIGSPVAHKQFPRLGSVKSARKSPQAKLNPSLPKIAMDNDESVTPPVSREKVTISAQGRRVLNKILSESEKGKGKPTNSSVQKAIDKWLSTATDKEREVALKFFSTLAGTRTEFMNAPSMKYHTHSEGDCNYCDGDRINETLDALAKSDKMFPKSKVTFHKKEPKLGHHSVYQHPRLSTGVRRSYQTWHHLPVYRYDNGVPNKSSMFTQPHRYIGRHFSIHPEWGLHTGLKPAAF